MRISLIRFLLCCLIAYQYACDDEQQAINVTTEDQKISTMDQHIEDQKLEPKDQEISMRSDATVDQAIVDQAIVDQAIIDQAIVDQAIVDQAIMDMEMDMLIEDQFIPSNTNALSCVGEYCPSSRLISLDMPANPAVAIQRTCDALGYHRGSSFYNVFSLLGFDISRLFEPNDFGNIPLVILAHLDGWQQGLTGNENEFVNLQFFKGFQTNALFDFSIDPSSWVNQDASQGAVIQFPQSRTYNARLESSTSQFNLSLELIPSLPFELALESAKVKGDLSLDAIGFNLRNAVLDGYMKDDRLFDFVNQLIAQCTVETPANFCATLGSFLNLQDPQASLSTVLTLLGGYDARVEDDGNVVGCERANQNCCRNVDNVCYPANALSVCLLLEMNAINIIQ
jgi:hypothetical protein